MTGRVVNRLLRADTPSDPAVPAPKRVDDDKLVVSKKTLRELILESIGMAKKTGEGDPGAGGA